MKPLLAISMGCPAGVGPEVTLAALDPRAFRVVVFGDVDVLRSRADIVGARVRPIEIATLADARALAPDEVGVVHAGPKLAEDDARPGRPSKRAGAAQLAWIDAACDAVVRGDAHALVTGPVSKAAIASSGAPGSEGFLGHTEHLGARLGGVDTVMTFHAESLTISLATTHLPLSSVARVLRAEDVSRAAYWTARFVDDLGVDPSLAVAVLALNPHAGEDGLLGDEERTILAPGIDDARARLAREGRARTIVGPLGAEGAIRRAVRDRAFAACVAMYHDQATIPSKLVAFGESVNVTLGLPIVRTSVDHGTAYDLAGTGRADASGMRAALELAAKLSEKRVTTR